MTDTPVVTTITTTLPKSPAEIAGNSGNPQVSSIDRTISTVEQVVNGVAPELQGKALIASKTPWGVIAAYVVGVVGAKYGLGMDEASTQIVAGAAVLAASYAMRLITSMPITGILKKL